MSIRRSSKPCPECGGVAASSKARLEFRVNGESVYVAGVPHYRCRKCGEALLELEAATSLQSRAHEVYREQHELLTPEQIVELRERLGISQSQLGRLLQLGTNTVSRWETGRKVQSASMDTFLRVLRDVPGTAEYLAKRVA